MNPKEREVRKMRKMSKSTGVYQWGTVKDARLTLSDAGNRRARYVAACMRIADHLGAAKTLQHRHTGDITVYYEGYTWRILPRYGRLCDLWVDTGKTVWAGYDFVDQSDWFGRFDLERL